MNKISKPFKKIIGVFLVIVGVLGIIIPFISFLVLFPLGLEFLGLTNFRQKIRNLDLKTRRKNKKLDK